MAEPQPHTVHEGATGDVEEEVVKAKSADARKAAAALASLDSRGDGTEAAQVDAAAASKAVNNLGAASSAEKKDVKKVKVDAADVALLVDELELTKQKATELIKIHDGDAVRAMKAFIAVSF